MFAHTFICTITYTSIRSIPCIPTYTHKKYNPLPASFYIVSTVTVYTSYRKSLDAIDKAQL